MWTARWREISSGHRKLLLICECLQQVGSGSVSGDAALFSGMRRRRLFTAQYAEKSPGRYLDGILVRNLESIRFLERIGFDRNVITDHNLYVFNRFSKEFMKKAGFSEFTAPAELNESELKILGLETAELTVYGYRPVMISAQCIMKTRGKCTKNSSFTQMKDRIGEEFLVQNRCDECYNIVYNSAPLYLGTQKVRFKSFHRKD